MVHLWIVIAIMCISAYLSEKNEEWESLFSAAAVVAYALFVGLRTSYNDTANYIRSFNGAVPLSEFLKDPERMNLFHNPLFYGFIAWMRGLTDNYHVFFMVVAVFNAVLLIRFFRKHSYGHFAYAILLFWGYGVGIFGAAAMKQITAMAVLTLAYEALIKRKWIRFLVAVLIASLIHTYAILFLAMAFFFSRPWDWRTTLLIVITSMVLLAFNPTIASVLDYADELGKSVATYEVFDGHGMNIFRVLVFAIPPILLFVYRRRLIPLMDQAQYVLANMSIICFMFILLGSVEGANMFGRLATYFAFGNICLLGWTIEQLFDDASQRILFLLSTTLFIVFIWTDNRSIDSYGGYACISLLDFIRGVI